MLLGRIPWTRGEDGGATILRRRAGGEFLALLGVVAMIGWGAYSEAGFGSGLMLVPLALGFVGARLWRFGVTALEVGPAGLKTRTLRRLRTIRWDEIEEVRLATHEGPRGTLSLGIELAGGEWIHPVPGGVDVVTAYRAIAAMAPPGVLADAPVT